MDLQTATLFGGLSAVAIVYWLVQHARRAGLLKAPWQTFLAPGLIWAVLVGAWTWAQQPRPPMYTVLLLWLGGWVATLVFKAAAKDNERQPPAP